MTKEKEIEKIFKDYAEDNPDELDIEFTMESLRKAISSGDLYTKSDVEKEKIKAKIELLKSFIENLNYQDFGYRTMSIPSLKVYLDDFEQQLMKILIQN